MQHLAMPIGDLLPDIPPIVPPDKAWRQQLWSAGEVDIDKIAHGFPYLVTTDCKSPAQINQATNMIPDSTEAFNLEKCLLKFIRNHQHHLNCRHITHLLKQHSLIPEL